MTHEAQPLSIPRLSERAAGAAGCFYGRAGLPFALAGRTWTFIPDASARPGRWRARVYANLDGRNLALFLDNLLAADWEGSGLDPAALASLPTELAGAALELACRDLADALSDALGKAVSVDGLNLEEEEAWLPDEALCFTLVREDGSTVAGALTADDFLLADLANLYSRAAPPLAADVSALRTRCRIVLAGPELESAELAVLETGDILLTAIPAADTETAGLPVTLRASRGTDAPARLLGTRLSLEGPMMQETPVLPEEAAEEQDEQKSPAAVAGHGELPLRIEFDLGGLSLSVAEMAALAPGRVLSTGRDVASPVRITVAGKSIGAGSLFDVGGRVGVRVESLTLKQPER